MTIPEQGFTLAPAVLPIEALALLIASTITPEQGRGGVRNLLDLATFRELANSPQIRALVTPILGSGAFPVRGILFEKTSCSNWKVPWHQDVTIAVTNRINTESYGPWSIKEGVTHVQPPAHILEHMLSVRLHLDDCPAANGALRVLPGSHRSGKLTQSAIDACVARVPPHTCEATAGDALLMRPLLIHASSPSTNPAHRRVIHFDYANVELADGLVWRERRATIATEAHHA